jgi:hypothetical protein
MFSGATRQMPIMATMILLVIIMGWFLPFLDTPQDYIETPTSTPIPLDIDEVDDKLTVCLLQPRLREDQDDPLQATDRVVALMQAAACQSQSQGQHMDLFVNG